MRKIFLFFAAMLTALAVNATSTTVGSDDPTAVHTQAIKSALGTSVDTIFVKAGTYNETERWSLSTSKVIMALGDAKPVVKPYKDNRITNGAKIKIIGLKFDGSELTSSYEYFIRSYDATVGNELRFDGCEMSGFATQYLVNASGASRTIDSVIFNDCKCINNGNDAIYIGAGSETKETCKGVIVKNSTFANFAALAHSVIEVDNYNATKTPNIEVTVDHCTFYNNPTSASGYADIRVAKSTKVAISNCVFSYPTEITDRCATYCYGGSISNCLVWNKNHGTKGHRADDITPAACLYADPLFTDAANADFTLSTTSPAIDAGSDGKTLGDPRWWPVITYPETDFSGTGYEFKADDATCAGQIDLITDSEPHYLRYADYANPGTASWKITATAACQVKVTLNLGTYGSHKHIFEVQLWDADGLNKLDTIAEGAAWASGPGDDGFTEDNQNKTLDGYLTIPAAGTYTVKLLNNRHNSKMGIYSVTMQAIQTIYFKAGDWANDGAKFGIYAYQDALPEYFSDIMVLAENETAIYNTTIPAGYTHVVFIRMSGDATEVKWAGLWNQTEDLTIPEGKDMFTFTSWDGGADGKSTGTWSKYEYVAPVKFYIAGSMTDWDDNKIPVYDDSYTLNLAADTYQLKVVDNGSWKGIGNLTTIPDGIYIDQDNNICFVLAAAGDVTVNYKSGELFTLEGDFVAPEVKLIGSNELGAWHAEDAVALTPASDKKTAAVTIKLANEWYDFKVIRNGEWLGKVNEGDGNYRIHSEFTTVDGLVRDYEGLKSISLQPSVVNKDYTFTWTYATGQLAVTFPSSGTALDNTAVADKAQKFMENGQLFIRRDGKIYTTTGVQVK
jgi:hypothetical protein